MHTRILTALVALAPLAVACNSGGGGEAGGADESAEAPTLVGSWTGTISRVEGESEDHTIEVLDHTSGQLQLGLQDFCNIDLQGDAPTWTSVDDATCLVDLGDGRNPTPVSATVRLEGDTVLIMATFDGDTMWTFEGTR